MIAEGRDFTEIYAARGVPASPFPAERMLKVLDGLKAMDAGMRRAAVTAMDAADDAWTVEDVAADASAKAKALQDEKAHLQDQAASTLERCNAAAKARDEKRDADVAEIRKQIQQLEELVAREITTAAQNSAALVAEGRAAQDTAIRETARIDVEIRRMLEIPLSILPAAESAAPAA
ncbi:MAG: hypothetical protein M3O62_14470 [Pseudomonadota bacterium]|nr:hypothetical protein [Pseudomonadota bacterium]